VVQTVCAPAVQPVMQTVYKQVPVTEYQPVQEMARRQVMETKYVDQAVTAYRPITEVKTASVPTVSYQNVTECQTVSRNAGYWRSRCEPTCKMSPCQYDNRPGITGWFNRTSYEMTSAFQPQYRTTREYVPQTIVQQVPVTRQVAVQGSRQVTYNETRMEAYQTTQKVAISVPRWEEYPTTVMKPVTVVKTMAVGTQVTYVPIGSGNTATALGPSPDTIGRGTNPSRSADSLRDADPATPDNRRGSMEAVPSLQRQRLVPTSYPVSGSSLAAQEEVDSPLFDADFVGLGRATSKPFTGPIAVTAAKPVTPKSVTTKPEAKKTVSTPAAARAAQWVARSKSSTPAATPAAVSVADTARP
jgi:hypothetical protein